MADVIDLVQRREMARLEAAIAHGRVPLARTHLPDEELASRIARIKESLAKINSLMIELKEKNDADAGRN